MNVKPRKLLLAAIDIGILAIACIFMQAGALNRANLISTAALIACIILSRFAFRVYKHMWRYASSTEFLAITMADFVGGCAYYALERFLLPAPLTFAYSVSAVTLSLIGALSARFLYRELIARRAASAAPNGGANKIAVGIIGAGHIGAMLANELEWSQASRYRPYCFIDINNSKVGSYIGKYRVYGEDENIVETIKSMPVQELIIALKHMDAAKKNRLFQLYEQTGCKIRIYDFPFERALQRDGKRTIRDINIEDLLFRDSITFDGGVAPYYLGKRILITGAGGSIGSELCRQLAKMRPGMMVLVDIYENNVYDIEQELARVYEGQLETPIEIASVRDRDKLKSIMEHYRPQIVFHAAAHKHVHLMEHNCDEAVKNNVFGTWNAISVAEECGVEKFIFISTDKAVNPTNIMGATKRLCEMMIQSKQQSKTVFTAVRFGNVLGSNGSVIPLFRRQIEAGGPVTLTDKRIIRYFMTIPEAAQLVIQSGAMAKRSEVFVLDMGRPIRILDLAENMIRLAGLTPYQDIDIVEIGLRPGEKLYEELLIKTEEMDKTGSAQIFIERDRPVTPEELRKKLESVRAAVATCDMGVIREAMKQAVPTFSEPEEVNSHALEADEMKNVVGGAAEELPPELKAADLISFSK